MGRILTGKNCCWTFLVWTCRIWGLLTALGLWGSGSEAVYFSHIIGVYLLITAAVVTLFELLFFYEYCTDIILEESCCFKFYSKLSVLDDWKRGIFYCLFAIPCFLYPTVVILGVVSGIMLAISGILYMFKTFKTRHEEKNKELENKATYDRFEELQEDIEDSIINPTAMFTLPGLDEQPDALDIFEV